MKKWTKVLSAFVVATVMSAGMAAIAGCDGCGDDDKGDQHQHTYKSEWKTDETNHWHESDCGHDDSEHRPHEDNFINGTDTAGHDNLCDVCGYEMQVPDDENKVTVTFNSNGGSAVASQTIDKGGKITEPPEPTKTTGDTKFEGWYRDNNTFLQAFDFNTAVNEGFTLYAKWGAATPQPVSKVTVTFNTDGGKETIPSQTVDAGEVIEKPEDPTKDGFKFDGWYEDDGTYANDFDFDSPVDADVDLIAKWVAKTQFDVLSDREDNVISEDFKDKTDADFTVFGGTYGNKGIYVANQKGNEDIASAFTVSGGALDVGKGSKDTDNNALAVVDFGVVSGTVEGYFKLNISAESSSGTFNTVTFKNQSSDILKIEAIGGGNFKYTLMGTEATPETVIASAANTNYVVEFKFDLTAKTLTLKINDKAVFTAVDVDADAITGFTVQTSNHGQRHFVIDDIAVCGTAVSAEAYKADLVAKLEAKLAAMTEGEEATHKVNADAVTAACDTDSVNDADDNVEAYKAYVAAVAAMDLVAGDLQAAPAAAIEEAFPIANYTQNRAAYEAQIAILLAETDAAKLDTTTGETYLAVYTAISKIKSDNTLLGEYANAEFVKLVTAFPETNYQLSADEYADVMQSGEGEMPTGTYDEIIAAIDDLIAEMRTALQALDTDATIIQAYVDEKAPEIAAYGDTTGVKADTVTVVEGLRTKYAADLNAEVDKILASDGYDNAEADTYYQTVLDGIVADAKTAIDEAIAADSLTLEVRKENAVEAYEDYCMDVLTDLAEKDKDFSDELLDEISEETHKLNVDFQAALDAITENDASVVNAAVDDAKDAFDKWVAEQCAAKTYDVTLHLANGTTVAATVKFGTKLDGFDPTSAINNVMLNPEKSGAFTDAELETAYEDAEAYAELHYSVVLAKLVAESTVSFSHAAITDMTQDDVKLPVDKFEGTVNSFLTITAADLVSYRSKTINAKAVDCIQNANDGLQVTFESAGTLTISFSSTGGSNNSRLGLKDASGKMISGTTSATLITDGDDAGTYEVTGTTAVNVTFTVTAGTYTISCPTAITGRGTRIFAVDKTISAHKVAADEEDIVKLTGVELAATANVQVGKSVKLELTATPADAGYTAVWSSDSDKVTVDQQGNVTAAADATVDSTATITVVVTDTMDPSITFEKTCTVTVIVASNAVLYTYTYGGDNATVWDASACSNNQDNGKTVTGLKIEPAKALKLNVTGTKITNISATGFSNAGAAAMELTFYLKDADGNTVGTLVGNSPANKAVGAYTFSATTVTATAQFTYIEILCTTSGKHTSIQTLNITIE